MKKLLFIIILNAFLFSSGSVYLSVDVQNDFGYHSDFLDADFDNSFENGSIVLGYSKTVYQKDQFLLDIGCSFSIKPSGDEDKNDALDTGADYYNLYIMPNFQISDRLNLWTKLGEVSCRTNISDLKLKPGLGYGIGISLMTTDHLGIGLGYRVYNTEADMSFYQNGEYDFDASNSSIIHFKVKRMSVDLFYRFN